MGACRPFDIGTLEVQVCGCYRFAHFGVGLRVSGSPRNQVQTVDSKNEYGYGMICDGYVLPFQALGSGNDLGSGDDPILSCWLLL